MKRTSNCIVCFSEKETDEYSCIKYECPEIPKILDMWKICKSHKEEIEKHMADCSVCGSQDTTFKSGTSKKTGKPWRAWDCNEPNCKNEKGYPNRTFEFTGKPKLKGKPVNIPGGDFQGIHRKLDMILTALGVKTSLGAANEELQTLAEEEQTPF